MSRPEWLDHLHDYARPTGAGARFDLRVHVGADGHGNLQFVGEDGRGGAEQVVGRLDEAVDTFKALWQKAAEIRDNPSTGHDREERGRRMVEALETLAARGTFAQVDDPAAWERELREDRPLPGREP